MTDPTASMCAPFIAHTVTSTIVTIMITLKSDPANRAAVGIAQAWITGPALAAGFSSARSSTWARLLSLGEGGGGGDELCLR